MGTKQEDVSQESQISGYRSRKQQSPQLGTKKHRTLLSRNNPRCHIPNHRDRASSHLTEKQALELIEAATHARTIGRPLNRFVTIHLERGKNGRRAQEAIGHYLRMAGQWLATRGSPSTFVWVLEHAQGTGLHAHMLLHIPPEHVKQFADLARSEWLRHAGLQFAPGLIKSERVGPRGFNPTEAKDYERQSYRRSLQGTLRYMLKAIDPEAKSTLARYLPHAADTTISTLLGIDTEYCQPIKGRRCSRSQNISKAARERYAAERLGPIAGTATWVRT